MQLWTDPTFWQDDEYPEHFVTINGRPVPNTTTLRELGLGLTQNSVYSDPGEYNAVSPLALPPPALINQPHSRIQRSLALPKKRKTVKRTTNNRFGFKKAYGALKKGIKKLTGRSRKNRRT